MNHPLNVAPKVLSIHRHITTNQQQHIKQPTPTKNIVKPHLLTIPLINTISPTSEKNQS